MRFNFFTIAVLGAVCLVDVAQNVRLGEDKKKEVTLRPDPAGGDCKYADMSTDDKKAQTDTDVDADADYCNQMPIMNVAGSNGCQCEWQKPWDQRVAEAIQWREDMCSQDSSWCHALKQVKLDERNAACKATFTDKATCDADKLCNWDDAGSACNGITSAAFDKLEDDREAKCQAVKNNDKEECEKLKDDCEFKEDNRGKCMPKPFPLPKK